MISDSLLDQLAVHVLKVWLLSMGFQPSDEADCKDYGPHRVWTVQARVPDDVDMTAAQLAFNYYFLEQNKLPGSVKFHPYNLTFYKCPCGYDCDGYVFASIYN